MAIAPVILAALWATLSFASARPNVVLIMADDLGWGDLGCYGQQKILTPRLDRMAEEGTKFTSFYCGLSVCAPSRAVLMTGVHTGHATVRANNCATIPNGDAIPFHADEITLARAMQKAGYATALFGKWGLGELKSTGAPLAQGFDDYVGYLNQTHAHNYWPEFLWKNDRRIALPNVVHPTRIPGSGIATTRKVYSPDHLTSAALKWLDEHSAEPFFLYLPFTLPHVNNEAGHEKLREHLPKDHAPRLGLEVPDLGPYAARPWPETAKGYAAMVSRLDASVGQIFDKLTALGLDEKTLVFFTSDNGPSAEAGNDPAFFQSAGSWRGIKRGLTEGGLRVPMLVRWPGKVPAGRSNDTPWAAWDLFATLAHLCRLEAPARLDGLNVWPLLTGAESTLTQRDLYWEIHEPTVTAALRRGPWKLIVDHQNVSSLYHLDDDPTESKNLATAQPELVKTLRAAMVQARIPSPLWPCLLDSLIP
jgi:arylsulfatase A-like enzyme